MKNWLFLTGSIIAVIGVLSFLALETITHEIENIGKKKHKSKDHQKNKKSLSKTKSRQMENLPPLKY